MTPNEALEKAISMIGSMQSLADHLGVTKGAVGQWKGDDRKVPAEHCPVIERLTSGVITCEQLRPDVEWPVIRNSKQSRAHRKTDPPKYARKYPDPKVSE